jgi:hypothetical protein
MAGSRRSLDHQPAKTGRLKRDAATTVHYRSGGRMIRAMTCKVPKGTPVALIDGRWLVADLAWLEPLCEAPAGFERASTIYYGATENGVQVDAADVAVGR